MTSIRLLAPALALISSDKFAGVQQGISVMADWRPWKHVNLYAGVMLSSVFAGLSMDSTRRSTGIRQPASTLLLISGRLVDHRAGVFRLLGAYHCGPQTVP